MANLNLTPKQQRFVEEYLIDLNATQAAIRAGYSKKTAGRIASQNLSKLDIQMAISEAIQKRSERTQITADRVLQEYALIAFSNMGDYIRFEGGEAYLDFSDLTEDQMRVIGEITQDVAWEGKGEQAQQILKTKFKLHSKLSALNDIAKHLGLFVERHEHSGPDGGPIPYEEMTSEERRRRIDELNHRRRS